MRFAVVFPGQGSQGVGMGCDVASHSLSARATFDRAAAVLGYDLLALQRDGPEETLRETEFSQPAIFTTNLALYAAVGPSLAPVVTAGHSFAELCSLVIARSLPFEDALRIVSERGKAMQAAAECARGGMSAILGLQSDQIREVLERVRADHGGRVTLSELQLAHADRDQRRLRRGANREPSVTRRWGEARRAAQRLRRVAQRTDGAGIGAACRRRGGESISLSLRST